MSTAQAQQHLQLALVETERKVYPHTAKTLGKCLGCGKMWEAGDPYWLIRYDGVAAWACGSVNCRTPPTPAENDATEIAAPADEAYESEHDGAPTTQTDGDPANTTVAADAGPVVMPSPKPDPKPLHLPPPEPAFVPASDAQIAAVANEVQRIESIVEEALTKPSQVGDAQIRPNPAKVGMYVKFVWDALYSNNK